MTRFLLYTETYPASTPESPRQTGIGNYCSDLATGLAALGHSVTVLTADGGCTGETSAHASVIVERTGCAPRTPPGFLRRASTLRRRLAAFKPDYLLVGDPTAHKVVALAGLPREIRYCPIFYGTELRGYNELLFAYRGWKPTRRIGRRLLAAYINRAYRPICISRYTAGCLAALGLPPRPECLVFPAVSQRFLKRPVDAAAVAQLRTRRPGGAASDVVRYITVARISERKNQLQVLEALAALRRRDGLRFQYVIVGNVDSDAHSAYFESIRRFSRDQGLTDEVVVVGQASDDEKIDWIDASDVFVMLSRTVRHGVEGFGISVIEASCRGKPVVVSDEGGMPETIVEGETGLSVPLHSPGAIAAALLALARRPELRRTLGANGVRFVRENFTPQRMAERLTEHLGTRGVGRPVRPGPYPATHGNLTPIQR